MIILLAAHFPSQFIPSYPQGLFKEDRGQLTQTNEGTIVAVSEYQKEKHRTDLEGIRHQGEPLQGLISPLAAFISQAFNL